MTREAVIVEAGGAIVSTIAGITRRRRMRRREWSRRLVAAER